MDSLHKIKLNVWPKIVLSASQSTEDSFVQYVFALYVILLLLSVRYMKIITLPVRYCLILSACTFMCGCFSKTLMMLSHDTGVGSLSNQLCSILDIQRSSDNDPYIMRESTLSKSLISCHLLVTEDNKHSSARLLGLDAVIYKML